MCSAAAAYTMRPCSREYLATLSLRLKGSQPGYVSGPAPPSSPRKNGALRMLANPLRLLATSVRFSAVFLLFPRVGSRSSCVASLHRIGQVILVQRVACTTEFLYQFSRGRGQRNARVLIPW